GQKLFFETFKHLTTLSTGSVLLLATFLKDVFKAPQWPFLVGISFALLILSTLSSVLVMLMLSHSVQEGGKPSDSATNLSATGFVVSVGGFLLGIIALVIFATRNFY